MLSASSGRRRGSSPPVDESRAATWTRSGFGISLTCDSGQSRRPDLPGRRVVTLRIGGRQLSKRLRQVTLKCQVVQPFPVVIF